MSAVEELIRDFERRSTGQTRVDLLVLEPLTLGGQVVASDVGMTVLLDRILALRFEPDGFTETPSGRTYHYKRWE